MNWSGKMWPLRDVANFFGDALDRCSSPENRFWLPLDVRRENAFSQVGGRMTTFRDTESQWTDEAGLIGTGSIPSTSVVPHQSENSQEPTTSPFSS